ncbi:hypothetical protein H0H81_011568 [Sphagnurus paluster]|uniref:Uncharacterized protein n=1 Tax=Sphagnurus paluster TaxID=117069 RepID=A0A9P7GQV0_9AGAR|nr:hypothetical protein H0H81_011568 [Sphagnurus paluster]
MYKDVDDELDIDGDEGFGEAQFTEGDILPVNSSSRVEVEQDLEVEIEGDSEDEAQREQKTLRDLVAEGKLVRNTSGSGADEVKAKMEEVMGLGDTDKMDLAILAARKRGDKSSLITALENKVKQLVSLTTHLPPRFELNHPLGIDACFFLDITLVSDLHRSL